MYHAPLCVCVCCSFTNISTTAQDSYLLMIPSMSNNAICWVQRKRKSKMKRNLRVRRKKAHQCAFKENKNKQEKHILKPQTRSTFSFKCLSFFFVAKLKKVKKKKKRGEGEFVDEERPFVTKIFAKFSHDAPLPMVKKKHLTVEQLNARRRKVWLTIAKKEIPKVS